MGGVGHTRAWFVDLCAIDLGISLNAISKRLFSEGLNPANIGTPMSHISPKTDRFANLPVDTKKLYAHNIFSVIMKIATSTGQELGQKTSASLSEGLLSLRCAATVSLQRLNPLLLVLEADVYKLGCELRQNKAESLIGDLAGEARVGVFEAYTINSSDGRKVFCNFLAVHDNNGDHKSKEWGARRLATLYRQMDGKIQKSEYQEALFVLDGEWHDKEVARLYRSGWNRVVRLGELESTLREIFDIKGKVKKPKVPPKLIGLPEEDDLPLAAEKYEPLTLKR